MDMEFHLSQFTLVCNATVEFLTTVLFNASGIIHKMNYLACLSNEALLCLIFGPRDIYLDIYCRIYSIYRDKYLYSVDEDKEKNDRQTHSMKKRLKTYCIHYFFF